MSGFVDLHCHWIPQIDDGARSIDEGLEMLRRLREIGFSHVVGTPHMRPGMFENTAEDLRNAYFRAKDAVRQEDLMPDISLGSEHFFDLNVVEKIQNGHGLPYRLNFDELETERLGGAILVEFLDLRPLPALERFCIFLQERGYLPVIAHPERYQASWTSNDALKRLVQLGAHALLDTAALVGKYGKRAEGAAQQFLADGFYTAACSDAHRPSDIRLVAQGMEWIRDRFGDSEVERLFKSGPTALIDGKRPN